MDGPATEAYHPQFSTVVFPSELEVVWRRREAARRSSTSEPGWPEPRRTQPQSSTEHELMGLALSGGGIRSASFSLGVLQGLSSFGLLSRVDYVSTVSGGGLIGASLSCLLNRPGVSAETVPIDPVPSAVARATQLPPGVEQFPLGFECGTSERPAVRHLRSRTKWLAPGGGLEDIRLPAVVLRGILDNFSLLLPLLMLGVLVTEQLFAIAYRIGMDRLQYVPLIGAAIFAAIALSQPVLFRIFPARYLDSWSARNRYEQILTVALLLEAAILVIVPLFLVEQQAIDLGWRDMQAWYVTHRPLFWGVVVTIFATMAAAARFAFFSPNTLVGRLSLVLVGLIGHGIVFTLFVVLTLIQIESPVLSYGTGTSAVVQDLDAPTVSARLSGAMRAMGHDVSEGTPIVHGGSASYPRWSMAARGEMGPVLVTRWRSSIRVVNTLSWDGQAELPFLGIGIAGLLYAIFFANANITSAHGFFRDRMSHAFLIAVKDQRIEYEDDLKLSQLNGADTSAPYHLLNVTLNLQGARDVDLSGRDADFFVLARNYSGSPTTGYCQTAELEARDPHLNLGTAIAISGAGLAPNAGTTTVKALVYLATLLNLRLDYWLANPRYVTSTSMLRRARYFVSVGPLYLLKEALGRLDARGPFVNLSDGGHLENLGVYELLRRRCRWIVAVDASEDPTMTCSCLMDVVRFARIDLGIVITIDTDRIRPRGTPPVSAEHFAIGVIDYGDGEYGTLVYLKTSMTGDEPDTIRQYRETSPSFPQESSDDQFFTETQFEAYRSLGEHVITSVVAHTTGHESRVEWPVDLRFSPLPLVEARA